MSRVNETPNRQQYLLDIRRLIDGSMKVTDFNLYDLSKKQLLKLHKFYHLKFRGFSKCAIITQLLPIKQRCLRIKMLEDRVKVLADNEYKEDCPMCFMKLEPNTFSITWCGCLSCMECMVCHVIDERNEFCAICKEPVDEVIRGSSLIREPYSN
jgi:hypothetical protein